MEESDPLSTSSSFLANALRPARDGKIFEHFMVVGCPLTVDLSPITPKSHTTFTPQVLFQFPQNIPVSTEHAANFCFPANVEVKAVERTKSASGFNEVMFGQVSKLAQTERSFIFLISGAEHLLYGVCVSNQELLHAGNTLIERPENLVEVRSKYDFFTNRVYCILSKFPFFRLHFEVIYSILDRERLRKIAFAVGVTEDEQLKLEKEGNEIITLLQAYYEKEVPKEMESLTFTLPGELRSVQFSCPPGDEDKQISDWGIVTTFTLFSLENIILLFGALLLEKQIIFVSPNLGSLSAVVLSWLPLLRPYVFQGAVIPILPTSMYEYMDAPVPYVVGIPEFPKDDEFVNRILSEKIVIDIENRKIKIPQDMQLPPIPEPKKLLSKIKDHYKELQQTKKVDPYKTLSEQLKAVPAIVQAFKAYHVWLVDEVLRQLGNLQCNEDFDFDEEKQIEKLVQSMPKSNRTFMSFFLRTQQFSTYSDKLKAHIKKKTQPTPAAPRSPYRHRSLNEIDLTALNLRGSLDK